MLKINSGQNFQHNINELYNNPNIVTGGGHHVHFQEMEFEEKTKSNLKSIDIESSLESLCLQMMEHALGP